MTLASSSGLTDRPRMSDPGRVPRHYCSRAANGYGARVRSRSARVGESCSGAFAAATTESGGGYTDAPYAAKPSMKNVNIDHHRALKRSASVTIGVAAGRDCSNFDKSGDATCAGFAREMPRSSDTTRSAPPLRALCSRTTRFKF